VVFKGKSRIRAARRFAAPGQIRYALGMTDAPKPDIDKLPFEKALAELEGIVQKLERGEVPLEESIALYERGEGLKKRCETLLREAEARIEKITLSADGQPRGLEALDRAD
jgi:exodeoxyribonuclease VII small subunit